MASKPMVAFQFKEFSLEVLSGSEKGKLFKFKQEKVALGRASDNDVSIPLDAKISRIHVNFLNDGSSVVVSNLSDKNYVLVNGDRVSSKKLSNGDQLTIGDTVLKFTLLEGFQQQGAVNRVPTMRTPSGTQIVRPPAGPPSTGPTPNSASPYQKSSQTRPRPARKASPGIDSGKLQFYGIIGAILLIGAWLFLSPNKQKTEELKLRSITDIQSDIDKSTERIQNFTDEMSALGKDSDEFKKAQASYIKGRRDFQQGRYERAMQAFQATLTIDPRHKLAERYLMLTRRKFDENISSLMMQGRNYLDRGQYSMCRSSFAMVLTQLSSQQDKRFEEAKQIFNECDFKSKGSY